MAMASSTGYGDFGSLDASDYVLGCSNSIIIFIYSSTGPLAARFLAKSVQRLWQSERGYLLLDRKRILLYSFYPVPFTVPPVFERAHGNCIFESLRAVTQPLASALA